MTEPEPSTRASTSQRPARPGRDSWYLVSGAWLHGLGPVAFSGDGRLWRGDGQVEVGDGWRWLDAAHTLLVSPEHRLVVEVGRGVVRTASDGEVAAGRAATEPVTLVADLLGLTIATHGEAGPAMRFVPLRMQPMTDRLLLDRPWSDPLARRQRELVDLVQYNILTRIDGLPQVEADLVLRHGGRQAEWRLRHLSALGAPHKGGEGTADEASPVTSIDGAPRWLPPGFADADPHAASARRFALGHHGRLLRLGDIQLTTAAGLADAASRALPAAHAGLREPLRLAALSYLARFDVRLATQLMLEGGLTLTVPGHEVTVRFDLGDLRLARQARTEEAEQVPIGSAWHVLVNADHEVQSFARASVANTRKLSLGYGGLTGGGPLTGSLGLGASSGREYGQGSDWVSAVKRYLDVAGHSVYYDFGGASMRTEVRAIGARPGTAAEHGSLARPIRAEFPRDLALVRPDGRTGVVASEPVVLGPQLGVGTDAYRRALTASGDAGDGEPVEVRQARAVTRALGHVLTVPESAPGLDRVRRAVLERLDAGRRNLTEDATHQVEWWLSEPGFLRMFADVVGSGAISPAFASGGSQLHVTWSGRLLNVQAVSQENVPVKEETQRFGADHHDSVESGGLGPDGQFSGGKVWGNPDDDHAWSVGLSGGFSLSAEHAGHRGTRAVRGAGDIRGLVYAGDSVRYRLTMEVSAEIATDLPGVDQSTPVRDVVDVFVRIPVQHRARFEELVRRAVRDASLSPRDLAGLPTDRDPGEAAEVSRLHPPAALAANQGIGQSALERLAGAEDVLPALLAMVDEAERKIAGPQPRSRLVQAELHRLFSSRVSREALINAGSQLYDPAGVGFTFNLRGDGGTETIRVKVRGRHDATPYDAGRVASGKLEIMPAAFAGATGDDKLTSNHGIGGRLGVVASLPWKHTSIGASFRAAYNRAADEAGSVSVSGFQVQAMLYKGPMRWFDYRADLLLEVDVEFRRSWTGVVRSVTQWAKSRGEAKVVTRASATPRTVEASSRLVLPEHSARAAPASAAELLAGRSRELDAASARAAVEAGHDPLNGDDLVVDVLGGKPLADLVTMMLLEPPARRSGWWGAFDRLKWLLRRDRITPGLAADLAARASDNAQLVGSQVRGPSAVEPTLTVKGMLTDSHYQVTVENFPVSSRPDGEATELMKMDVAEGTPVISHSRGRANSWSWGGALSLLWTLGKHNLGLDPSSGGSYAKHTGLATGISPQAGRLTQITQSYQPRVGNVIMRVTVTSRQKNMLGSFFTVRRERYREVTDGMHFYRPAAAPVTPAPVAAAPPAEAPVAAAPAADLPAGSADRSDLPDGRVHRRSVIRSRRSSVVARDTSPQAEQRGRDAARVPALRGRSNTVNTVTAMDRARAIGLGPLARSVPPGAVLAPVTEHRSPVTAEPAPPAAAAEAGPARLTTAELEAKYPAHLDRAPIASATERLLPAGPAGRVLNPTGAENAMLSVVDEVLPDAFRKQRWTMAGRERGTPAPLSAVLNPGTAVALVDTLVSGIKLTTTRSRLLYHERAVVDLRLVRDVNGTGYTRSGVLANVNVARYGFRLHNHTPSEDRTTTAETAAPGTFRRIFDAVKSLALIVTFRASSSETRSRSLTSIDATRDTLFLSGHAARYTSEGRIEADMVLVREPSRLLDLLLLGFGRPLLRLLTRREQASRPVTERIIVPEDLTLPPVDAGRFVPADLAVTALPEAGLPDGARPFDLTGEHVLARDAFPLGVHADKINALGDTVLADLRYRQHRWYLRPSGWLNQLRTWTWRRLVRPGARSNDAIEMLFNHPAFTKELDVMIGEAGLEVPKVVAEGGPLFDSHGRPNIKVRLVNPRIVNHINAWHEYSSYHFTEHKQGSGRAETNSQEVKATAAVDGGTATLGGAFSQSKSTSSAAVLKSQWPTTGSKREVPWLRVQTDAVVTVTLNARSVLRWLPIPFLGWRHRPVARTYLVKDLYELVLSPEGSLEFGLIHPLGIPTPAGFYLPSRLVVTDRSGSAEARRRRSDELHAAFSFTKVSDAVLLHVATGTAADGSLRFQVRGAELTTAEFHERVLVPLQLGRKDDLRGRTLVIVGANVGAAAHGGRSAADELADRIGGGTVVGPAGDVHTGPDGHLLAARAAVAGGQPYLAGVTTFVESAWTSEGLRRRVLSVDLAESLRFLGHTVPLPPKPVRPPSRPVSWGTGAAPADPLTGAGEPAPLEGIALADGRYLLHPRGQTLTRPQVAEANAFDGRPGEATVLAPGVHDAAAVLAAVGKLMNMLPAAGRTALRLPVREANLRLADGRSVAAHAAELFRVPVRAVLGPAENARIFAEKIAPAYDHGEPVTGRRRPVVLFVGGQTGAGKTAATTIARKEMRGLPQQFVEINMDDYTGHHGGYQPALAEDPQTASARVREDTQQWWDSAHRLAQDRQLNVLVESAMATPDEFERLARQYRDADFEVRLILLAVPEAISLLSVDLRAEEAPARGEPRRVVPRADHDRTFDGVLRGAEAADETDLVDRITVLRRHGELLYDNERGTDGQWRRPPAAAAAVAAERVRLLRSEEQWYEEKAGLMPQGLPTDAERRRQNQLFTAAVATSVPLPESVLTEDLVPFRGHLAEPVGRVYAELLTDLQAADERERQRVTREFAATRAGIGRRGYLGGGSGHVEHVLVESFGAAIRTALGLAPSTGSAEVVRRLRSVARDALAQDFRKFELEQPDHPLASRLYARGVDVRDPAVRAKYLNALTLGGGGAWSADSARALADVMLTTLRLSAVLLTGWGPELLGSSPHEPSGYLWGDSDGVDTVIRDSGAPIRTVAALRPAPEPVDPGLLGRVSQHLDPRPITDQRLARIRRLVVTGRHTVLRRRSEVDPAWDRHTVTIGELNLMTDAYHRARQVHEAEQSAASLGQLVARHRDLAALTRAAVPAGLESALRELNEHFGADYPVDDEQRLWQILDEVEASLEQNGLSMAVPASEADEWANEPYPTVDSRQIMNRHVEHPLSRPDGRLVRARLRFSAVVRMLGDAEGTKLVRDGWTALLRNQAGAEEFRERIALATGFRHDRKLVRRTGYLGGDLRPVLTGQATWGDIEHVTVHSGYSERHALDLALTPAQAWSLAQRINRAAFGGRAIASAGSPIGAPYDLQAHMEDRLRRVYHVTPDAGKAAVVEQLNDLAARQPGAPWVDRAELIELAGAAGVIGRTGRSVLRELLVRALETATRAQVRGLFGERLPTGREYWRAAQTLVEIHLGEASDADVAELARLAGVADPDAEQTIDRIRREARDHFRLPLDPAALRTARPVELASGVYVPPLAGGDPAHDPIAGTAGAMPASAGWFVLVLRRDLVDQLVAGDEIARIRLVRALRSTKRWRTGVATAKASGRPRPDIGLWLPDEAGDDLGWQRTSQVAQWLVAALDLHQVVAAPHVLRPSVGRLPAGQVAALRVTRHAVRRLRVGLTQAMAVERRVPSAAPDRLRTVVEAPEETTGAAPAAPAARVGPLPLPRPVVNGDLGLARWLAVDPVADPVSSRRLFDTAAARLTVADAVLAVDTLLAGRPGDERLLVARALLSLAEAGHLELGYRYLAGGGAVAALLQASRPDALAALAALARAARFGEGRAALLDAVASVFAAGGAGPAVTGVAGGRAEVGRAERVEIVLGLAVLGAAFPQQRAGLRLVAATLVDCD
ncbi:zeta toxin family protein [Dactylosporangium sp. NPDC000244]|uniref:zeta toxin family protein n=1 Tax=Dactylosporangium sp. NPDC000244 TaxID=3154365 RepID=UPI0033318B5F